MLCLVMNVVHSWPQVVILSLVRNAGNDEDDARSFGRTIGFLKVSVKI